MPVLGILTNNQHDVFQRNVITGICSVAEKRGFDVIIDAYADDLANPQSISLDYHAVDGVLVISNAAPPDLLRSIHAANIPLTFVSHQAPDLPIPAVITDNQQGIELLIKHLAVTCGRKQLVFIRGIPGQRDSDERELAFRHELMRYNLFVPPERWLRGDFSADVASESMIRLLESDADFDGVVASDYLMGVASVNILRQAGIAVPEDVAVVGFGDGPDAEEAGLTVVAADVVEQGKRAARQLISQIEGFQIRGVTILSVHLRVRDTSIVAE